MKTLITSVLAAASLLMTASAATTYVIDDLSTTSTVTEGETYVTATVDGTSVSLSGDTCTDNSSNQCSTSITLALDLDTLLTAFNEGTFSASQLMRVGVSGNLTGLAINTSGEIYFQWRQGTYSTSVTNCTLFTQDDAGTWSVSSALADLVYTDNDGHSHLNVTYTVSTSGSFLYDSNGNQIGSASGLHSSNNTTASIYIVTSTYVDAVAVTNDVLTDSEAIATVSSSLKTAVIPEPATATLSLLALAGLAARRRRK